ncbi:MAG: sigma 54-interacting transcriptional regulator [Colwellia sp.]|nr:sigma 54-interacting transcriptional regulator [Colwellia sp.]MCW9080320.1 sigma 54-interacting transcriptional regulator [Colwellia sp.]
MRIEIQSSDRIGISQEILSAFAKQAWNLKAVEVTACFTFAHLEHANIQLADISHCLENISGIISIKEIALLPIEQRENHLQMLLDRIPDPIIDIDHQGIILAVNSATKKLLLNGETSDQIDLIEQPIEAFIEQKVENLLTDKAATHSLSFNGKTYLADISPVISRHNQLTGAMITLRSMKAVGRQLALIQGHQEHSFENIIGGSAKILRIKEQGERFAKLDLPVLISGETGTGKELIARALHQKSDRAKAPFLAINCAALPEHLLESELFGYSAGAFTSARKAGKPGLIELAEGGSIFLDEIAEMSVYLQAKLLRFLQDFSYRRVGGTKELHANVRVISASHQDLSLLIANQSFREDLFYRLNVLNVDLPPLRERADDIILLAQHFIDNASKQVKQTMQEQISPPTLTEPALALLKAYHWPGNIRQLQNVLFSVVALSVSDRIEAIDIEQVLAKYSQGEQSPISYEKQVAGTDISNNDWASAQASFEEQLLRQLYPLFPTTRKLAERLKVSHNKIAMKLRKYGIH